MTSTNVFQGIAAIKRPEVQDLIRRLGAHGLGVTIPHQHTDADVMTTLPSRTVQFEDNPQVSFVTEGDPFLTDSVPVSWVWDDELRIVGRCRQGYGGSVPPPQL
jgi:hypothetical protein